MDHLPPAARPNGEPPPAHPSPAIDKVLRLDKGSTVTVIGHPMHAMLVHFPIALVMATLGCDVLYWYTGDAFWPRAGVWAAGATFWFGVAAALVGTVELLGAAGIRNRVASWSHAVAAMTMLSITAANWRLRVALPDEVLPHGLILSLMGAVFAGFAGFHGGKLVFEHGIGTSLAPDPATAEPSDPAAHPAPLG